LPGLGYAAWSPWSTARFLAFHNGRGAQEKIFAEAKSQAQLEYVPVRRLYGNQLYCLAAMLAHNLTREMQMQSGDREFGTSEKRRPYGRSNPSAQFANASCSEPRDSFDRKGA
jgi:hypothetical protein